MLRVIMLVGICCLGSRQNNKAIKEINKKKGKIDFLKTSYLTFHMQEKKNAWSKGNKLRAIF